VFCLVQWYLVTDVSKDRIALILDVKQYKALASVLSVTLFFWVVTTFRPVDIY
jgi:hypothetical protein